MLSRHSKLYLLLKGGYNFADKLIGSNFVIFLKSHSLSSTQIGILLAVSSWVTSLLDFPTGNISDLQGRKKTSLFGLFIFGIGLIIYGSGSLFWHFLIALGLMGSGCAFISGALTAWYVDELKKDHLEKESAKVFALSNGVSYSLSAFAGLCATFLLFYSMRLPFLVGGIAACILAASCSFFMRENYGEQHEQYTEFLKNTLKVFAVSKKITLYTLMQITSGVGLIYFILSWQPYLLSYGLKKQWLGIMYTLMMLAIALTGFIIAKFITEHTVSLWVISGLLLMAIAFFVMYLSPNIYAAVASTVMFQVSLCIKMSASAAWINKNIESNRRASILSAISTFTNLTEAILFITTGSVIDSIGLKTGLLVPFITCIVGTLIFLKVLIQENRKLTKNNIHQETAIT